MRSLLTATLVIFAVPATGPAQVVTRVADGATHVPGGTGNFILFDAPAVAADGTVAFHGAEANFARTGVYTWSAGSLTRVADTTSTIPGGSGSFFDVVNPAAAVGTGVFYGTGSGTQTGIYAGPPLARVADTATTIPGGTGNFTDFGAPAMSGATAAFAGFGTGQAGIYTSAGGTATRVMDKNTVIPNGTGKFTNVSGDVAISGGFIAFHGQGSSGQNGLYTSAGGTPTRVVDKATGVPGGTGNFTTLGAPSLSGLTLAFYGAGGSSQSGVYFGSGGPLTTVANRSTAIPGGTGLFTGFGTMPAIDGGAVAFVGDGAGGQEGLFLSYGGQFTRVIGAGDALDGRVVQGLSLSSFGLSGGSLAFAADFTNGTSGVYVTSVAVPEPSALLLAGSAVGVWLARRQRRTDTTSKPIGRRL